MLAKRLLTSIEHPNALGSFRNWLELLRRSDGVEARYFGRVTFVVLSTLLTSPLRFYERARYTRTLNGVMIHPSPIFIVGHWRSGTTHLHNLLCQDPNLGYISTFQAMAPGFSLVGERLFKPALASITHRIHPTRIINSMPLSLDAPQEEDYAVACQSPYSFLQLFTFPHQAQMYVERYALLENLPSGELENWIQNYLSVLRVATFRNGGKRLVLKSPANSGRLPEILKLFPKARFIHLTRNPYDVFLSMRNLYHSVLPRAQLQRIDAAEVDACILKFYSLLMKKFLGERSLIPPGNLVEVQFEKLEQEPMAQLGRIYEDLDLPGFKEAKSPARAYLASVADYRKNRYCLDDDVIQQVNRHWGFAFEAWGYDRLQPGV